MPESTGTNRRGSRVAHPHHRPTALVAIAGGGALGTLARYGVERRFVPSPHGFPWATFAVNVIGSFVLGIVITLVIERWPNDRLLRPLVAVGFCGGFTTFSTMAVEVDRRMQHGHTAVALTYLVATVVVGLMAALVGITVARGRVVPADQGLDVPDPDLLGDDAPGDFRSDRDDRR